MDPNVDVVDVNQVEPPAEPPAEPPQEDPDRPKRTTRYVMHILHIIIAFVLLAAVIADLISPDRSLFIVYLLPTIALILVIEAHYLLHKVPPLSLRQSYLAPSGLQRRSFVYQVAGAFVVGSSAYTRPYYPYYPTHIEGVNTIGKIVLAIGVAMYVLYMLSKEYGFLDWVEEPQPEDEEQGGGEEERTASSTPAQLFEDSTGKRIARYLLHILHFIIAILLIVFIILNAISHVSTFFTLYLLPFIIHILIIEICHLFRRNPPQVLRQSVIAPPNLRRRAFAYQLAGAYALAFSGYRQWDWYRLYHPIVQVATGFASAVWLLGIALFALAIAGKEYDCMDWLEEPAGQGTIRLDDEESVQDQFRRPPSIRSQSST